MILLRDRIWTIEPRNIFSRAGLAVLSLLVATAVTACADRFGIVDYQPSAFAEQPTAPFFFSIGDGLRFDHSIDETSTVLFSGKITAVYPSPDEKKAAIISDGKLYLVEPGQPPKLLLTAVDNFSAITRSVGERFYEYPTLQWDAHSRTLFIIRATSDNGRTQMFPRGSTLVRIDLAEPGHSTDVVPDLRSEHYFLVGDDAVCFGDVIWKCTHNGVVMVLKAIEDDRILLENGISIKGKPFLSYQPNIYESEIWLTFYGFSLRPTQDKKFGFFRRIDRTLRSYWSKLATILRGSLSMESCSPDAPFFRAEGMLY